MVMKIPKLKFKIPNSQAGMTYVELIVVLSIFAVMSSIVIFNYGTFQSKVDIKNLGSDIALKIVEAQKSSLAGLLPTQTPTISPWKPSYGVYFNSTPDAFIYFADLNDDASFEGSVCSGECIEHIAITQNNTIKSLDVFYQNDPTAYPLSDLTVTFTRPNSGAIIKSSTSFASTISYVEITITSPNAITSTIDLYPSGRVQVN